MIRISRLSPEQWDEAAQLIHRSLRTWYGSNLNRADKFGDDWRAFRAMPEIYESLDPGCAVTAIGDDGGLLGVCFYHPRETHVAVGIVSTAATSGGRGVARAMMEEVLRVADAAGKPVRLVSSAMNLDSFSLYTRLGFVPHTLFQDMILPGGPPSRPPDFSGTVRPGRPEDAPAMADLEFALCGIRREHDWSAFLAAGDAGIWKVRIAEGPSGRMSGFLCSVDHPGSNMIGPGVAEDDSTALALLHAQLSLYPGRTPVFLVPVRAADLVRTLYSWGARNTELHVAQARGPARPPDGICFPTFMPETG